MIFKPTLLKRTTLFSAILAITTLPVFSQPEVAAKATPIFKDGEAQVVPAFDTPDKWIRHDLWVETTFDTDGDGKPTSREIATIPMDLVVLAIGQARLVELVRRFPGGRCHCPAASFRTLEAMAVRARRMAITQF